MAFPGKPSCETSRKADRETERDYVIAGEGIENALSS